MCTVVRKKLADMREQYRMHAAIAATGSDRTKPAGPTTIRSGQQLLPLDG